MTGTVKFFDATKGWGFIKPDGGGVDVFLHKTELSKSQLTEVDEGDRIGFEMIEGKAGKGPKAASITAESGPAR